MKKILAFILILVMVVSVVPMGAFALTASAATQYTEGYYTYTVENGEATITNFDSSISGDIVIPSTLGGYTVKSIGDYAFAGHSKLTSIIIPDGVTSIGICAFNRCRNITSVTIPNSVISIGEEAFCECYRLTSITIPDSVISIGYNAFFSYGEGLTEIIVNEANQYYCDIDGVLFDKTVTTLILYPAANTNTLYTVPSGVTSIGDGAFSWCCNLTDITIPNSVVCINDYAFYNCERLTNITIPDSVKSIGDSAFAGYSKLTSVTIPNSVTSIGNGAFAECDNLASINVNKDNEYYCDIDGVLFDKSTTTLIRYPGGKTNISTSYTIPSGVINIGSNAFSRCYNLTSVVIPDCVTNIGDSAFYQCNRITSITIPNSVTSIGDEAFYWCNSLTSVDFGNEITSIGDWAFSWCESLTSITIPGSITSIGDSAFSFCTGLTSIFYRGSEEQKENIIVAANNESLTNATWYYNSCIASTTHTDGDPVIENRIEPTCTEDGSYDSVVYCSVCDDELSRETITIEALGHEFPTPPDVVYPGWGDDGWEEFYPDEAYYYTCIRCGYYAGIPFPILPPTHNGEIIIENYVEPTCITVGSYDEVTRCVVCCEEISRSHVIVDIDSENHVNTQWYSIDSCTSKGSYEKCLDCGKIISEISNPVINHRYSVTIVEPTCTQEGYTLYSCDRCIHSYVEEFVSPTGHTYSNECDRDCNTCGDFRKAPHKYDNACDDECDLCGTQRDVEEHIYDNACDNDCNECGIVRDITHVYNNVCDADCNICGKIRVDNHSYSNVCDIDCNICGFIRTVEHIFTNECDGECDLCFDTRKAPHKYANACDSECDLCGKTRVVSGHIYDDENDTFCNICGKNISNDTTIPMFVVSSVSANAGQTFKITISTVNNPGIVSMKLCVGYDAEILELVSYQEGEFSNLAYGPIYKNPFIVNWVDTIHPNNSTNGVVATLAFKVKEGAVFEKSEITLTYDPEDVFDSDYENVYFDTQSGYVTLINLSISGDTNGDGKINGKDYALLLQSINGWDVTIDTTAADVNGDGKINGKDYALLLQHINGWDVELH